MSDNDLIFLVKSSPEGGYEAQAVNTSIFTEADTLDELKVMVKDAVNCHFDDGDRPTFIRLHFVGEEVFAL